MATIKRDINKLFTDRGHYNDINFLHGKCCRVCWDNIPDGDYHKWGNPNYNMLNIYKESPSLRYLMDCELDKAGVLMPSVEEVDVVYRNHAFANTTLKNLMCRIDKNLFEHGNVLSGSSTMQEFKSNPAYFLAYVKLLRAIEAKADGVDVNLDKVVESCKPKTEESTMSQKTIHRAKLINGAYLTAEKLPDGRVHIVSENVIHCRHSTESALRIANTIRCAADGESPSDTTYIDH